MLNIMYSFLLGFACVISSLSLMYISVWKLCWTSMTRSPVSKSAC